MFLIKCLLQLPLQVLTAAQVLGRTVRKSFLTGDGQQEVFTGHVLGRRRNWCVPNAEP